MGFTMRPVVCAVSAVNFNHAHVSVPSRQKGRGAVELFAEGQKALQNSNQSRLGQMDWRRRRRWKRVHSWLFFLSVCLLSPPSLRFYESHTNSTCRDNRCLRKPHAQNLLLHARADPCCTTLQIRYWRLWSRRGIDDRRVLVLMRGLQKLCRSSTNSIAGIWWPWWPWWSRRSRRGLYEHLKLFSAK